VLRRPAWQPTYPAEGDSPVPELLFGGELIGDLRLENIQVDRRGNERLAETRAVLSLYPATTAIREFELDSFLLILQEARDWLLDNERGREPEELADPS